VTGGLLAGAVMALLMAAWGVATGNGVWYPVNLIAATFIPSLQSVASADVATLAQFSLAGAVVGSALHFGLAALVGLLFVALLPTLPGSPALWSAVVGPILWFIAEVLALPLVNPLMATLTAPASLFISNVVYSLILGIWVSRAKKVVV
jgi:hypothetical protein